MIMGIDASTTCIGWSVFDETKLKDYGKIKPTTDNLEWRQRIPNMIKQLEYILDKYNIKEVYIEDVPLMAKGGKLILVQLGAVQGALLLLCLKFNIEVHFIKVGSWRAEIGLYDGTVKGKERDTLKQHSIELANKIFNINLKCEFTKSGKYSSAKSDDDIADAILIASSTIPKYQVKKNTIGRKTKTS